MLLLLEKAYQKGFSTIPTHTLCNIEEAYAAIGINLEARLLLILKNILPEEQDEAEINPNPYRDSGLVLIEPGIDDDGCDQTDASSNQPIEMKPIDPEKLAKFRQRMQEFRMFRQHELSNK